MANEQVQRYVNLSEKVDPEVANAVRSLFNVVKDHFDAISALKGQVDKTSSDVTSVTSTVNKGAGVSVALSMPEEFDVVGSPVAGVGTLSVTKVSQAPNKFYGGPMSGADDAPSFRKLAIEDIAQFRFSQLIGDGVASTFVITHNLGTKGVLVQVQETGGLDRLVMVETEITDINHVTIVFGAAPALNSHLVVIEV